MSSLLSLVSSSPRVLAVSFDVSAVVIGQGQEKRQGKESSWVEVPMWAVVGLDVDFVGEGGLHFGGVAVFSALFERFQHTGVVVVAFQTSFFNAPGVVRDAPLPSPPKSTPSPLKPTSPHPSSSPSHLNFPLSLLVSLRCHCAPC